jgi:menin
MEYIYDRPTTPPQESAHWKSLSHAPGDRSIDDLRQLREEFAQSLRSNLVPAPSGIATVVPLALWSLLLGYCESLCTSNRQRYNPFPIPIDALRRLMEQEFTPPTVLPTVDRSNKEDQAVAQTAGKGVAEDEATRRQPISHRRAAREVSNWVWSKVVPKANVKDEKHANSLYTVLRGRIEHKSVDCFGAALVTVISLRQQGYPSVLTLSEDHAYETHGDSDTHGDGDKEPTSWTCEVAIPGNTKAQKQKRGQEIAETFKNRALTASTSWLYMGGNAVKCQTSPMILAAAIANMNCLIENKSNYEKYSQPLLEMKRDLLWILKDRGQIDRFPFAICELGWSEEHASSPRGEAQVSIPWEASPVQVTTMEALYHEAVAPSQQNYRDKQVYPYCYLGFFHKDGGQEEEYRLGLALQFFAEAARVASSYKYESGDTLQLTKVFTKCSEFILNEILCANGKPRAWQEQANAITCGRWLVAFFDRLLLWEEQSGTDSFVPICQSHHKTGLAKAFAQLSPQIRRQALEAASTQSQRLNGPLRGALLVETAKPTITEMHLTILADTRRRRKRKVPS